MNNFTKEELAIIYCNLCINPKTKDILIKLQSMIDNYCEHDKCPNPECNLNRHPSNVGCIKLNEGLNDNQ